VSNRAFLGRQPILNRQSQIVGYELLFRDHAGAERAEVESDLAAGAQVFANLLTNMGANWLLGDKLAFINVSKEMLQTEFLQLLPADRVVLEVAAEVKPSAKMLQILEQRVAEGFTLCLDDFELGRDGAALLALASYVKLDLGKLGAERVALVCDKLKQSTAQPIAKRVETKDEFEVCARAGISFFQGYYFARPTTLSAKTVSAACLNILELMRLARDNAHVSQLEDVLKRDVALSFKLLRYINSAGIGARSEVSSLRHAVAVLGYQKLYHWLTLLLITAGAPSAPPALAKTAVARGFLAERLGRNYFSAERLGELFMVGAFSLLEPMFEAPKEILFSQMTLPPNVQEALLKRQGVYAPFLSLVEVCDRYDFDALATEAGALNLSPEEVNEAQLSAIARVEELGI
jgi:c-di-GMP phosphodiesterase